MEWLSEIDLWMIITFVLLLGMVFGSFATAVAYRVPRGEQFMIGHSRCPHCGHTLGVMDLFPVISWLFLRGKCRYCGAKFGTSYIGVELAMAAMFLWVYLVVGATPSALILAGLALCLVIMTVIDLEHYIIPDGLNLSMFLLAIGYQWVNDASWQQFVFGPFIGVAIGLALRWMMWFWKRKEGLGLGDVKFLAVAGVFLPSGLIITFLFFAGVLGVVTAVFWRIKGKGERFPFGPSLGFSMFICLLHPELQEWWYKIVAGWVLALYGY